jgi:hypothetical protein
MADFRGMKLGRRPASFMGTAFLRDLPSFSALPLQPEWSDYSDVVPQWPMLKNDELGDCAEAALLHIFQLFKAINGQVTFPDDQSVVELYSAAGGYVPGDPSTDQGTQLNALLQYAKSNTAGAPYNVSMAPEYVQAFAYLQHTDLAHVSQCVALFKALFVGVNLRQAQMTQEVWDAGSSAVIGGHAITVIGANNTGPKIISWGKVIQATWAWWTQCVEEAWVVLNYDFTGIGEKYQMLVNEANALTKG